MRLVVLAAAAALLAAPPASATDLARYEAYYVKGGSTLIMRPQPTPIPVPAQGSGIAVSENGQLIAGTADTVRMFVERRTVSPEITMQTYRLYVYIK